MLVVMRTDILFRIVIIFMFLSASGFAQLENGGEQRQVTGEVPLNSPWYTQTVLEGELLQPPYPINSNSLILFTSDSVIQSFSFEKKVLWKHHFDRIPQNIWHPQNNGSVMIVMQDRLQSFSATGLIGSDSFPWPARAIGESLAIIDGRMLNIQASGEVELFATALRETEALLRWSLPSRIAGNLLISQAGTIILREKGHLAWYALDGRLLAREIIGKDWADPVLLGTELLIHSPSQGLYRRYNLSGSQLSAGPARARGRLIASIALKNSNAQIQFYIDDGELLLYGPSWSPGWAPDSAPDGQYHSLMRLDPPWEYGHIVHKAGYLYLSDSAWRLHRFNIQLLAEEFFGELPFIPADLLVEVSSSPAAKQAANSFLAKLLVSLLNKPTELRHQLRSMSAQENFRPGHLLIYEAALLNLLQRMYTAKATLTTPSLRLFGLQVFFQYAGTDASLVVFDLLKEERNPLVFLAIIPLLAGKPIIVHIEFIKRLNILLQSIFPLPASITQSCASYFGELSAELPSENSELRVLIKAGLGILFSGTP